MTVLLIAQPQVGFAADHCRIGDIHGVVFVGAHDAEVAFDRAGLRHGVFTFAESTKERTGNDGSLDKCHGIVPVATVVCHSAIDRARHDGGIVAIAK